MTAEIEALKIVELEEAIITLRSDHIVHVVFKAGTHVTVEVQNKMYAVYFELCGEMKTGFVFEALDDVTITKEARKNSVDTEGKTPIKASALVTTSLAYKLIGQFFIKVNKPKKPFKLFSSVEEAVKWLKSLD